MAARIITYHLKSDPEKTDYEGFARVLQSYDYIQLSETAYAVATDEYPEHIFQKLEPFIDPEDCLMVVALCRFYMTHHNPDVLEWLNANV
jgi:hypothetical protein